MGVQRIVKAVDPLYDKHGSPAKTEKPAGFPASAAFKVKDRDFHLFPGKEGQELFIKTGDIQGLKFFGPGLFFIGEGIIRVSQGVVHIEAPPGEAFPGCHRGEKSQGTAGQVMAKPGSFPNRL
jgi:hypothetical protein